MIHEKIHIYQRKYPHKTQELYKFYVLNRKPAICPNCGTEYIEPIIETMYSEGFKGLNDLHFTSNGDLYFTDQGQTGIIDPTGRVFMLTASGELHKLVTNAPSPNGITVNNSENQVYVARLCLAQQRSNWGLRVT